MIDFFKNLFRQPSEEDGKKGTGKIKHHETAI